MALAIWPFSFHNQRRSGLGREVFMRLAGLFLLSIALAAVASAQDTNFSVGPQYLVTTQSTMFLHPIVTPSLSLEPATPSVSAGREESSAESQPVPSAKGPLPQADLARVYWGDDWVRYVRGESSSASAGESESEIEVTSPQTTPPLPSSFFEVGVIRMTDAKSVIASGYGMTLGEVSAYWKAKHRTPHVYTNADIARLHKS
jgi:hypothetical protein